MLNKSTIKKGIEYCCEDIRNIENYEEAVNSPKRYCCHHRLGVEVAREELIEKGLYFNRPASELIFLEWGEHTRLHKKSENNPWLGKHHTEATKKKQSDALKGKYIGENSPRYGKHHTDEARKKMSNNHADFKGENHPMYGKHHTVETRQKMSDSIKGENHPMAKQCNINGITYGSIADAYRELNPNYTYKTFLIKYKEGKL